MVNEMVQGVFESAGQDLVSEVDGDEFPLCIGVGFVTGHCNSLCRG